MLREAVRLVIEGRVQGVGYRWWAVRKAQQLELDGWVRNRADGSVELVAIGDPGRIHQLIEACRQGPPHAAVRQVSAEPVADDGLRGFEQRPTA